MSSNTPVPKTILGRNRDMSHYDPASDSRSVQAQASVCPPAHAYPSGGSISSLSSAGKQARRASTVHHIRKGRDHFGIKSRLATPSPPNPKANAASTRRAAPTTIAHAATAPTTSTIARVAPAPNIALAAPARATARAARARTTTRTHTAARAAPARTIARAPEDIRIQTPFPKQRKLSSTAASMGSNGTSTTATSMVSRLTRHPEDGRSHSEFPFGSPLFFC